MWRLFIMRWRDQETNGMYEWLVVGGDDGPVIDPHEEEVVREVTFVDTKAGFMAPRLQPGTLFQNLVGLCEAINDTDGLPLLEELFTQIRNSGKEETVPSPASVAKSPKEEEHGHTL